MSLPQWHCHQPHARLVSRVLCVCACCVLTLIVSKGWPTVSCAMPATVPAVRSIAAFMEEDCCCWAAHCHVADPRCTVVSGGTGTITAPSCRPSIEPVMGFGCAAAALMSNSKCRSPLWLDTKGIAISYNSCTPRQGRAASLEAVMQQLRRVLPLSAMHRSSCVLRLIVGRACFVQSTSRVGSIAWPRHART